MAGSHFSLSLISPEKKNIPSALNWKLTWARIDVLDHELTPKKSIGISRRPLSAVESRGGDHMPLLLHVYSTIDIVVAPRASQLISLPRFN